jgi:shikimate kinase
MGSGKTTVGRIVADALGCPFVDLDKLIVQRDGRSIKEIFEADGEAFFRRAEEAALADTLKKYAQGDVVLSLGGGTILSAASRALLRDKTLCIWLDAPAEVLRARIGTNPKRPLADDDFAARLESRRPLYEEVAEITIDTESLSPQDIADEIIISCL